MGKRAKSGAQAILAPARTDPSRLEFLLELSHELRTPAGIIDGYLSLARQGELRIEDAVDVAAIKAKELCSLLDDLLVDAQRELAHKEDVLRAPMAVDQPRRARRRAQAGEASSCPGSERRDHFARAARDSLASTVGVHPRELGVLALATVLRLTRELQRREAAQGIAEEPESKDAS